MNKGLDSNGAQKSQQGTDAPYCEPVYMAYFAICFIMKEQEERLRDGIRVMPWRLILQQLWQDKIIR